MNGTQEVIKPESHAEKYYENYKRSEFQAKCILKYKNG